MPITLTKYIYPIEHEIVLSKSLGYSIDNPRTQEEIEFVKSYIDPALQRHYENGKPHHNPMLSAVFGVSKLRENTKNKDVYVNDYFERNKETSIGDLISQSWIIIRYSDNGEFDKVKSDKNNLFDIFFSEAKKIYWNTYNQLLSYFHLLSIFVHDDEDRYVGDSIILLKKPHDIFYPIEHTHEIIESFDTFHGTCSVIGENRRSSWNFFPDVRNQLIEYSSLLERFFIQDSTLYRNIKKPKQQTPKEKLLFIGDLLRVIENETHDVNVKLLLLVSIIEYMVTRNPDTNRFNIEDSILRQFVLKASIVIYNNNNEVKLDELKKNLKLIYDQRSLIAHGNFISEADKEKVILSFFIIYQYLRALLSQYLKDTKFIDFLKES